ncbi:GNAT family N-acetyltransferase [Saccharopolyspora sp. NPDC002376]
MRPEVVIRKRAAADITPAGQVLVRVHENDGYPVEGADDPGAWLSPAGLIQAWVGEVNSGVVGHVALTRPGSGDDAAEQWAALSGETDSEIAVLGRLFVHPDARGLAVGERLVRAVMDHATTHSLSLTLDVMEKDRAAIRLYERLGWGRIGQARHSFGDGESVPALCFAAPRPEGLGPALHAARG